MQKIREDIRFRRGEWGAGGAGVRGYGLGGGVMGDEIGFLICYSFVGLSSLKLYFVSL